MNETTRANAEENVRRGLPNIPYLSSAETLELLAEVDRLQGIIIDALVEAGEEEYFEAKPEKASAALVYVRRSLLKSGLKLPEVTNEEEA